MANSNVSASHTATTPATPASLAQIYHKLKVGMGHELVNDGNVHALISIAHGYGDNLVETLLREWEAPCGVVGGTAARARTA